MEFLSGKLRSGGCAARPSTSLLTLATVITLVPIIWVFASALKSNKEIRENALALPQEWRFQNYIDAWFRRQLRSAYFFNSIFITVTSVATRVDF